MQNKKDQLTNDFDVLQLTLASPERVEEWSYGEVTKPETINYRTQRPEKNGLFDEKIFGPSQDFECYCGKYKGIRFKGIVCDKCGVEITRAIVRRERMGHINLASPVAHIWFLRTIPSRIALLLNLTQSDVEKVVYFAGYIIISVDENERTKLLKDLNSEFKAKLSEVSDEERDALKEKANQAKREIESIRQGKVLDESDYHKFALKYGSMFEARIGAEAIYDIFKNIDLEKFIAELEEKLAKAPSSDKEKLRKRIALAKDMYFSGIRPEWMFLTKLPVIPPALRPMVALEGGRHASSDINDLYRRVINRNNRLKKLIEINAPDVILRNEKRILQEAIDALMDNSSARRGNTAFSIGGSRQRPLKSLADYLKGKQGYFRQNLLGKRVDYSGRSVIVVGPELKLDECGLPKHMALELFRPFVIQGLLAKEIAYNIRGAGKLIEEGIPEVWAILEDVIKDKHVFLNRAPTLHRQSIQAFRPVLVEGLAIQLHPLVCEAFNADFDGDQMAVHVPLTPEAQLEAKEIMSARKNILKPGSGEVTTNARQDMVLGIYWMTKVIDGAKGEGKYFDSPNGAILAYDYKNIDLRAKVYVLPSDSKKYERFDGTPFETTVGRLLFNSSLPKDFPYVNEVVDKKVMSRLVQELIDKYGLEGMPDILDKIKDFGFKYSTFAGITWGMSDLKVSDKKIQIIEETKEKVLQLKEQYSQGLLTKDERRRLSIELWQKAKVEIENLVMEAVDPNGSVHDMIASGARGSVGQLTQMIGMKGLIQNPKGDIIETPVIASYKEGFTPLEYFVSTHGSRKGLADTALKTAQAGYLTRRLFDVVQDIVITEESCSSRGFVTIKRVNTLGIEVPFAKTIKGRTLAQDVTDEKGNVVVKKGTLLSAQEAAQIDEMKHIDSVAVRSPMTCKSKYGVCRACYGYDLTTMQPVELGEAVGTVAAQSLGEPSTQLTMNTKHSGGAAALGGDITQGLPRVEEVFDRRSPKSPAVIARIDGVVTDVIDNENEKYIILAPEGGSKKSRKSDTEYKVPVLRKILVKRGDSVTKGQLMTDGSADLQELFKYAGKEVTQEYIISEILKIYELQGISVSRKHLEVILKQMFSRRKITDAGDTRFSVGQIVDLHIFEEENAKAQERGDVPARAEEIITGITETALTRNSWLSSASFQNTTRKLTENAIKGAKDPLVGLKENVIVGRLIPAGTGFEGSSKHEILQELIEEMDKQEELEKMEEGLAVTEEK